MLTLMCTVKDETKGQADKLQVTLDKLHETEEQLQTTIAKNKTLSGKLFKKIFFIFQML